MLVCPLYYGGTVSSIMSVVSAVLQLGIRLDLSQRNPHIDPAADKKLASVEFLQSDAIIVHDARFLSVPSTATSSISEL